MTMMIQLTLNHQGDEIQGNIYNGTITLETATIYVCVFIKHTIHSSVQCVHSNSTLRILSLMGVYISIMSAINYNWFS